MVKVWIATPSARNDGSEVSRLFSQKLAAMDRQAQVWS